MNDVDLESPHAAREPVLDASLEASRLPLADLASATLLGALVFLHLRRVHACYRWSALDEADASLWDWMCGDKDPFASYSFVPLHGLALGALAAWLYLSVRGSLGRAWRALRRESGGDESSANCRSLEVFLAAWCLCWFAPPSPFAASDDCADHLDTCRDWAAAGECSKNKAFMLDKCPKACKACVPATHHVLTWQAITAAVGPRAFTLIAAGALLSVAALRLLLDSLSDASRRRLAFCVRTALQPLHWALALLMSTPVGPLLLALLRLLRACLHSLGRVLRFAMSLVGACVNCGRRRLIVVLGGSLESDFTQGGFAGYPTKSR